MPSREYYEHNTKSSRRPPLDVARRLILSVPYLALVLSDRSIFFVRSVLPPWGLGFFWSEFWLSKCWRLVQAKKGGPWKHLEVPLPTAPPGTRSPGRAFEVRHESFVFGVRALIPCPRASHSFRSPYAAGRSHTPNTFPTSGTFRKV